jgi:hypothetical protein
MAGQHGEQFLLFQPYSAADAQPVPNGRRHEGQRPERYVAIKFESHHATSSGRTEEQAYEDDTGGRNYGR